MIYWKFAQYNIDFYVWGRFDRRYFIMGPFKPRIGAVLTESGVVFDWGHFDWQPLWSVNYPGYQYDFKCCGVQLITWFKHFLLWLLYSRLCFRMPILFATIARGTTVLAKYASCAGNFTEVSEQILAKIPPDNSKLTYSHGRCVKKFLLCFQQVRLKKYQFT